MMSLWLGSNSSLFRGQCGDLIFTSRIVNGIENVDVKHFYQVQATEKRDSKWTAVLLKTSQKAISLSSVGSHAKQSILTKILVTTASAGQQS